MSTPFLLNPSSLGFALRSSLLPGSQDPTSNQPILSSSSSPPSSQAAPAGVWGHFPSQVTSPSSSSLNLPASLSLSPAIFAQACTDGPIMATATGPIGTNTDNFTGYDEICRDPSKGKAPLILNHAANSVQAISGQVAQGTFFKDRVFAAVHVPSIGAFESDEVYYMDPSLGFLSPPTPIFSPAKSPATPTFSPPMPAHAQGIGAHVNAIGPHIMHNVNDITRTGFVRPIGPCGTTNAANDDVYGMRDPSKGKGPLIPNPINNGANQVYAIETHAEYLSLMNRVTHLSQTQSALNATMADMKTLNLGLKWWVVQAHIITSDKVSAHDQEIEKKIEDLHARVDKEKKKGEKMEAEQAKLEENVISLEENSVKLDSELEKKREKFERVKKKKEKIEKIVKYGFIGGVIVGVSVLASRFFK